MDKSIHKKIIIGITGASGSIYGIRLLSFLKDHAHIETHLIISEAGIRNIKIETDYSIEDIKNMADYYYNNDDTAASLSSSSFLTNGMIIAPCTVKTLSSITNSYNTNLITRAADVTLKEGRKLILMVRETPFHKGHLKLMIKASDIGALIMPPIPAFYHYPKTIDDIVNHTVGKALDLFGIQHNIFKRWEGI